eukprot:9485764-Pyramimonas_sp.AAC.1
MESSKLGLLPKLGPRNKLFVLFESSSEVLSIYARNSGCRRARELVQKTIQKHGGRSAVASE